MPKLYGKEVGPIGYGMMSILWPTNPLSDDKAAEVLKAALDAGCNLWNAGSFYGTPERNTLTLLNTYLEKHPEDAGKFALNVKSGMKLGQLVPDGRAEALNADIDRCVGQLGPRVHIDAFEMARVDPEVSLDDQLGALAAQVSAGKIGAVALSEVSAATIRKAAAITPIASVEIELSLFHTEALTNGILSTCHELGIPVLAYSPIGRGFLTGELKTLDDVPANDPRRHSPRYQPGVFEQNIRLVREIEKIAARKGCSPAQLAINWVRQLSGQPGMPTIIPIPGSSNPARIRQNAVVVDISADDLKDIDAILANFTPVGNRYPDAVNKYSNA